ncbi:MAG: hypothetical protein ACRD36_04715, partial [Candidatus Acidiferrum sp.]
MKRMLLAVVAAGLLWAASPARSDAQFRYDPSFPCGDCVGGGAGDYFPQGVHLGIAWSSPANMNPWLYRAFETGLLIHVNPLMFLPVADPGSLIEERCDPNEDGVFSHILLEAMDANAGNALFGVGVNSDAGLSGCCGHEHSAVDIKQTQREGWTFGIGVNSDCGHDGSFALYGKAAFNRMPIIFSSQSAAGFTCPHLMRSFQLPVVTFPVTPFDARSNLNNLLVAGNILRHGEELIDHGLFMDALRCFQQVHDLVPGTNLEGRANLDTQELLVRVYGTDDEKGAVEEQSTPDTPAPDPSLSPGMLVPPPPVIFKSAKATTVVYPVVELLGKDKETKLDDLDELVQVITSTIEPNSWAEAGGAGKIDYYYRSRALVIRQTAEVHEQVGDLLAALLRTKQQCEEGMEPDESTPAGNHTAKTTAKCEHCCPACSTMGVCCADCR